MIYARIFSVLLFSGLVSCTSNDSGTSSLSVAKENPRLARFSERPQFIPGCAEKLANPDSLFDKINKCMDPDWKRVFSDKMTPDELRGKLANSTRIGFDSLHGTQVSYFAPDGEIYLWYPGNSAPLKGNWKTASRTLSSNNEISVLCFLYSPKSHNPSTRQRGGVWNCGRGTEYLYVSDRETLAGDEYNLSSGNLPFVTKKNTRYSKEQLKAGA